jgi:hypothetical protein
MSNVRFGSVTVARTSLTPQGTDIVSAPDPSVVSGKDPSGGDVVTDLPASGWPFELLRTTWTSTRGTCTTNVFVLPEGHGQPLGGNDRQINDVPGREQLRVLAQSAEPRICRMLPDVVGLRPSRLGDGGQVVPRTNDVGLRVGRHGRLEATGWGRSATVLPDIVTAARDPARAAPRFRTRESMRDFVVKPRFHPAGRGRPRSVRSSDRGPRGRPRSVRSSDRGPRRRWADPPVLPRYGLERGIDSAPLSDNHRGVKPRVSGGSR